MPNTTILSDFVTFYREMYSPKTLSASDIFAKKTESFSIDDVIHPADQKWFSDHDKEATVKKGSIVYLGDEPFYGLLSEVDDGIINRTFPHIVDRPASDHLKLMVLGDNAVFKNKVSGYLADGLIQVKNTEGHQGSAEEPIKYFDALLQKIDHSLPLVRHQRGEQLGHSLTRTAQALAEILDLNDQQNAMMTGRDNLNVKDDEFPLIPAWELRHVLMDKWPGNRMTTDGKLHISGEDLPTADEVARLELYPWRSLRRGFIPEWIKEKIAEGDVPPSVSEAASVVISILDRLDDDANDLLFVVANPQEWIDAIRGTAIAAHHDNVDHLIDRFTKKQLLYADTRDLSFDNLLDACIGDGAKSQQSAEKRLHGLSGVDITTK
ncbi:MULTISPECIES: hypothetical protein [Corynebacterium]|uniref:hypothetical protein n=1 Tax=Corynebacterium TaxID=1716 RepID=UPI00195ED03F|nr:MULTISPECIES: hypothetical protein [Corynebacterium]MDN8624851.1 hypothetical protein [Corynebacterium kroppenstedtii]QRQ65553.1 hypothetical protein I6J23_03695 [Corynebacterium kroppenstedtii]